MKFSKYSSAGNDFLLFEASVFDDAQLGSDDIRKLCERSLGVGADGLLVLRRNPYEMVYFNSDGHPAEMCGNGLRAIAQHIKTYDSKPDTESRFVIKTQNFDYSVDISQKYPSVLMADISDAGKIEISDLEMSSLNSLYINTGVPHAVFQVENIDSFNAGSFESTARAIRLDNRFVAGTNVDFFEVLAPGKLKMRVFERGVEAETKSSGTGTTAVALAYAHFFEKTKLSDFEIIIATKGGQMQALVQANQQSIWLTGPVVEVFKGEINSNFCFS